MQLPMFEPKSSWRPLSPDKWPDWSKAKRIGIDTETKDPHLKELGPGALRHDSHMAGVSIALDDGPSFYLPIRHGGGGNVDEQQALRYLRETAKHFKGDLVGANLSYDLNFLASDGITFPSMGFVRDIQIAEPLIYELYNSYSLNSVAQRYGFEGKDEDTLREFAQVYGVNPKSEMWKLPAYAVGEYAEQDARLPLEIYDAQMAKLEEKNLWQIFNLESKLLPVLVKMHRKGVRIDLNKLSHIEKWSREQEKNALEEVKVRTGVRIQVGEVWQAGALVPALEAIGVKVPKTPTGKPSIDKDLFEKIDHPVASALARARKVNKLRTTFAASVRRHMIDGRIHTNFNQIARDDGDGGMKGARYGRLSSEHPNLQQQPARDEFASMWRSIYVPDTPLWAANDYSQQEPRMLIHFAELLQLPKAAEAAQRYRDDPTTDNHQMMADMAGIERKPAKELFLGKCYGMGGPKLCRKLGLPVGLMQKRDGRTIEVAGPEGKAIIDRFDQRLPFVRLLADECQRLAEKRGYLKTILGRRCHFPQDELGNYDWTHKALNRLIQGSSADQTKAAMVAVDAAGHELQLQVHDELDLSVRDLQQAKEVAQIMLDCVPLRLPSKVDIEIGPSWGEAEEIPYVG